jgi:hypothetical protein
MPLAALVPHLDRKLAAQRRDRLRQRQIQGPRALASAQHQQPPCIAARREALVRRWQDLDLAPHRIADRLRIEGVCKGIGEAAEHATGESCQHAVGEARHAILFVHHQRSAQQPRHQPAGACSETTQTQHAARSLPAQDARRPATVIAATSVAR